MQTEKFSIACPDFNDFSRKNSDSKRDYAHPIDGAIVKFLDNKIINSMFKQMIEMLADGTYGPVVATGITIGTTSYPEINALVEDCVQELSIKRPHVIISNAISELNAMAFGSDEEPYVALSPLMVKTMTPTQLKFVIGHECGHVAMGHMLYHTVITLATSFAGVIPVIGPIVSKVGIFPLKAWSRRSEITADRAGLLCCKSNAAAQRALLQITMPFMDANQVNIDDYIANSQAYLRKGITRKLNEFDDAHPIIPKRLHALQVYEKSANYYQVRGETPPVGALADSDLQAQIETIIKIL